MVALNTQRKRLNIPVGVKELGVCEMVGVFEKLEKALNIIEASRLLLALKPMQSHQCGSRFVQEKRK